MFDGVPQFSARSVDPRARLLSSREDTAASRDVSVALPSGLVDRKGKSLDGEELTFRFSGNPAGPVVFVLGGISANRFVAAQGDQKGWWSELVSVKGFVDLTEYCVVSADFLPSSTHAVYDLSTADYANAYAIGLKSLGIDQLDAVIGGSFGGMIGLELAARQDIAVKGLVALCAAHQSAPATSARRQIQREIIQLALASGKGEEGVAIARKLAMTTYRTDDEFNARFSGAADIAGYLNLCANRFTATITPERYLTLSSAIDAHQVDPALINVPFLAIAAGSDQLVPLGDVEHAVALAGANARLLTIQSDFGHDAFLKDCAIFGPSISTFLKETI